MESGDEMDALAYELGPGTSTTTSEWGPRAFFFAKIKEKKLAAKRLVSTKPGRQGFERQQTILDEETVLARELLAKWPSAVAMPTFSNVEGSCIVVFAAASALEDTKFKRWCDSKSVAIREAELDFHQMSTALTHSLAVKISLENWSALCNGDLLVQGSEYLCAGGSSSMNCVRWNISTQLEGEVEIAVQALQVRASKLELEEIFPSSGMRQAFLESSAIHEIDATKVLLLPEMTQGWIAWIESSATHPEAIAEYNAFAKRYKSKYGITLPPKNDYPYHAYVRTFGHMDEPLFFPPACLRWFFPQPLAHQNEAERLALEQSFVHKLKQVSSPFFADLSIEPKYRVQGFSAASLASEDGEFTTVRPKGIFPPRAHATPLSKAAAPRPCSPVKHSGPPVKPRFAVVVQAPVASVKASKPSSKSAAASKAKPVVALPVAKPVAAKKKLAPDAAFDESIFSAAMNDSSRDEQSRSAFDDSLPGLVPGAAAAAVPAAPPGPVVMPSFAAKLPVLAPAPPPKVAKPKPKPKAKADDDGAGTVGDGKQGAAPEERAKKKPKIDENVDVFKIFQDNKWDSVSIPSLREWLTKQGVKTKAKNTKPELVEIAKQYVCSKLGLPLPSSAPAAAPAPAPAPAAPVPS